MAKVLFVVLLIFTIACKIVPSKSKFPIPDTNGLSRRATSFNSTTEAVQPLTSTFVTDVVIDLPNIQKTMDWLLRQDFQTVAAIFLSETKHPPEGYKLTIQSCEISFQEVIDGYYAGIAYAPLRELQMNHRRRPDRNLRSHDDNSLTVGFSIVSKVSSYSLSEDFSVRDCAIYGLRNNFDGLLQRLYDENSFFYGSEMETSISPNTAPNPDKSGQQKLDPLMVSLIIIGALGSFIALALIVMKHNYRQKAPKEVNLKTVSKELNTFTTGCYMIDTSKSSIHPTTASASINESVINKSSINDISSVTSNSLNVP